MELAEWIAEWTKLAAYPKADVPDVDGRIAALLHLCTVPVKPAWPRPNPEDHIWDSGPYRRGDRNAPSQPERIVEHEILGPGKQMAEGRLCCGGRVLDGINAIPLTRRPKIEADVLLLVDHGQEQRLYLAEVKKNSNNAWYATVELLRQLRLFTASTHAADYFHRKDIHTPSGLPVTGVVLAPRDYYFAVGQKGKALDPARRLVDAVTSHGALDVRLATWDAASRRIVELER
jgi:hypothetical protein